MSLSKQMKLVLPNGSDDFPNRMATVLIEDSVVFLFSDTILNELAVKIDSLPAREAHDFTVRVFGSVSTARMNKKGKVSLREHPDVRQLLENGFEICRLKPGLFALVPPSATLHPGRIFTEDVARYLSEDRDGSPKAY